jgi:hypothetical protein
MNIEERIQNFIKKSRGTILPPPLQRLYFKRIYTAVILSVICVLVSVVLKNPVFLTGLLIVIYLIYIGLALKYQYTSGFINEYRGICISIKNIRNGYKIAILDSDDNAHVFSVSGKNVFFEQVNYVIYSLKGNDRVCIAFEEI